MKTDAAPIADRRTAAAIVHAEERREMLRELAHMGMTLARDLKNRVAFGDKPRAEPAPLFDGVARTIRLTLALEARMEEDMLAICRGELPNFARCAGRPIYDYRPEFQFEGPDFHLDGPELCTDSPQSRRVFEAVAKAAEHPYAGLDQPEEEKQARKARLERDYERLVDSEHYSRRVFHSFRQVVEAISDDLGLAPMWSTWSDETGFPDNFERLRWEKGKGWVEIPPEAGQAPPAEAEPADAVAPATPEPANDRRLE